MTNTKKQWTERDEEFMWLHIYLFLLSICILCVGIGLCGLTYVKWVHFLNCIGGRCG